MINCRNFLLVSGPTAKSDYWIIGDLEFCEDVDGIFL